MRASDTTLDKVRTALVVGLGRSGLAAARALVDRGAKVLASDAQEIVVPDDLVGRLDLHLGVDGDDLDRLLEGVDLLVPSPGVAQSAPVVRAAARDGIPVWSEPELGYRIAPRRLIGVTGTNGKTTVTEMITAMLRTAELGAIACGNIGNPFTPAALSSGADDLLVAELSSFQLHFTHQLRPDVGVLLNLAPDHLDWHGDMTAYGAAKACLWQAQGPSDWAVGNRDDPLASRLVHEHAPGRVAWTSLEEVPACGVGVADGMLVARIEEQERRLLAVDALTVAAPHHAAKVAAAACAALLVGCSPEAVAEAARRFQPGRHRLETVADVGGVRWINDSKATNAHAAVSALRAVGSQAQAIIWIGGGLSRGDLAPLGDALTGVRHAVLLGAAAPALAEILEENGVAHSLVDSIEEAVAVAARLARPGDAVLLAPACASLDQFSDYAERGDRFAAAVTGGGG
jgi:UDP-N-acetylmuramoylalanine--D-glutamate ligase